MTLRGRRVGLLVLGIVVFVSLVSATPVDLNPLVVRTEARGPVPVECESGLSPTPALRVDVREIPLPEADPAAAAAPPSSDLRAALQQAQNALARNDRPAFDEAHGRARAILAAYPPGAEARAAQEVLRIHEAAARIWDAQYRSPFFDEASPEYALVSGWPGWSDAVRRATLTDDAGRKFYPAAESRDFLARLAADRLKNLGIRSTTRIARAERPPLANDDVTRPLPQVRPRTKSTTVTKPRRTPSTSTSTSAARRPSRASRTASRKPAAATTTPSSPNPSAPPTAAAGDLPPVTGVVADATTGTTETAVPPAVADTPPTTTTVATTAPATDTVTTTPTTTAATTTTAEAPAQPGGRTRSVVLPTILILIGLGVLILLFRASR